MPEQSGAAKSSRGRPSSPEVRAAEVRPTVAQVSTSPVRRTLSVLALATAAALALAACTGDDPAPPVTVTPPASTAPATAPPTEAAPAGCAPTGTGVPADAAATETIDLDGDGLPDTLWLADADGSRTLGVTTASGATFTHPVDLAGPAGAAALAVHPDPATLPGVLLTDNRLADLLLVDDCALVDATDAAGAPWQFDLGFTGYGTGVGCLDLTGSGTTTLVGLDATGDGTTVTRTAIDLAGTVATAGTSDSVTLDPGDQTAIDTAHQITCGDRTLAADGVHEPQG